MPKYRSDLIRVGVDLDGTLAEPLWTPENPTDEIGDPIWANVEKLRALVDKNYRVYIYTSRPDYQVEVIERWLDGHNIPYRDVRTGKPLFKTLVDDRSTHPSAPDWSSPSDPDIAWAAGFFDGEGCTSVHRNGKQAYYPGLAISQKYREVLDRFERIVGRGRVYESSQPVPFSFQVNGTKQVATALALMWPHLGTRKKMQAHAVWDMMHDSGVRIQTALPDWDKGLNWPSCAECQQVMPNKRIDAMFCSKACKMKTFWRNNPTYKKTWREQRAKAAQ